MMEDKDSIGEWLEVRDTGVFYTLMGEPDSAKSL